MLYLKCSNYFQVEMNGKNRLHKTTSYYDAKITAKVGPSVFTFKSKMILNANDVRATGSQIGDEIWEKLWENGVFAEAAEIKFEPNKLNILGQAQVKEVEESHAHAQRDSNNGSSHLFMSFGSVVMTALCALALM